MTTHNTHHEHNDGDASVVEHLSVPERTVDSSTAETVTPAEADAQAGNSSSDEPATLAEVQTDVSQGSLEVPEPPVSPLEEIPVEAVEAVGTVDAVDSGEAIVPAEVMDAEQKAEPIQEAYSFDFVPAVDVEPIVPVFVSAGEDAADLQATPPVETKSEEIRSFTDFIEEFRLAEEARLNASRQDVTTETFTLLATEVAPPVAELHIISEDMPYNFGGVVPFSAPGSEIKSDGEDASASSADLHTPIEETSHVAPLTEETAQEPQAAPVAPVVPVERTVSPLLRPAARLRLPRHSAASRHVREEPVAESALVESVQPAEPAVSSTPLPVEQATPSVVEPEQPKPARRYRFDRPAANGSSGVTPVQPAPAPRVEENYRALIRSEMAPTNIELPIEQPVVETKSAASIDGMASTAPSTVEQPTQKQPAVESSSTSSTTAHSRRRQGQERQKEQPVVVPTADAVTPVKETTAHVDEIAPEDLPPLEYSELQKASTRRRRRHRTSSTNGSSAPIVAEIPVAPIVPIIPSVIPTPAAVAVPMPPVLPSIAPAAALPRAVSPAANGSQYSIVSGYTVNQMNQGSQGNEIAGPFMGPEPSPARGGGVTTRDGRTLRAEAQRTPVYPPARTHEAGPSSLSLNHFANVISQAIQTQTDRMVTELRHNSQAPTNVSVSLPPFPSTERVGVFVDVANLLYSARTLRIAVDFGKLLDFLRGNRRLVRAHAYCPTSPQVGDEQMFLQAVKGLGYRITTKNYKTFSSGAKKADLDLDLCMDVVRLVDGRAVDCVVLVSGDSDFMPMLDYCSDHGVRVEVAAFDEAMSATLRQSCDLFINLSLLEEIRS